MSYDEDELLVEERSFMLSNDEDESEDDENTEPKEMTDFGLDEEDPDNDS